MFNAAYVKRHIRSIRVAVSVVVKEKTLVFLEKFCRYDYP
jgi:hypothetical protein